MGVPESWAVVKGDLRGNGVKFFVDFLATYPQYLAKFPKLQGLGGAALASSPALEAQALAVMNALDSMVTNIGDRAALTATLSAIAGTHVGYGIESTYFKDAFTAFAAFLGKNGIPTDGWDAAIATVMEILTAQLVRNGGK